MARSIKAALRDARTEVDRFHQRSTAQGHTPGEETITDVLLVECGDTVRYAKFNKPQESRTGADWLWWFVDGATGEAFGMLVQAKCLKQTAGGRWSLDLPYRGKNQPTMQIEALLATAERFAVPACYVLYCGAEDHRNGFGCDHGGPGCRHCRAKSVSVLAAPIARHLVGMEHLQLEEADAGGKTWDPQWMAESAVRRSVALEQAAEPRHQQHQSAFRVVPQELAVQIAKPANTPRSTASFVFDQMAFHRMGMLDALPSAEVLRPIEPGAGGRMFSEASLGGQPLSYELEYSLQGLRTNLPDEIEYPFIGDWGGFEGLDGIAVFERPPRPGDIPTRR